MCVFRPRIAKLTAEDRQLLFRQASTAYKAEEVTLDTKVFNYACHRLQFTPDLDLFANSENA